MNVIRALFIKFSCILTVAVALQGRSENQQPLYAEPEPIKRVAIIGAGAAGASTAYHLRRFAGEAGIPTHITIYDRNDYIGGRSTTVDVYDDPRYPVELGASIFVSVNHVLQSAVADFNLSTGTVISPGIEEDDDPDVLLSIWDGTKLVLKHATGETANPLEGYWRQFRLLLRYGMAAVYTKNLVTEMVNRFLKLYDWPHFPFSDLTRVVNAVKLSQAASINGYEWLKLNKLTGRFAWEIVQAATRVNYASDLVDIHGMETMVSMAADGAMSVAGGNWQIFEHMAIHSGAVIQLGNPVHGLERLSDCEGYLVLSSSHPNGLPADAVVLAAPFHQMNLNISQADLEHIPENDPYRTLFVTLLTTPLPLSRAYFGLELHEAVPTTVLTTEPQCAEPSSDANHCSDQQSEFFSISTLQAVRSPTTGRREFLYKIFTSKHADNRFLARLLDLGLQKDDKISDADVSWIYRKTWLSYPIEYPRSQFESIRLDEDSKSDGVWYTGAMEGFISTMETNALMGKNVARLMVDTWTDGKQEEQDTSIQRGKISSDDESRRCEL